MMNRQYVEIPDSLISGHLIPTGGMIASVAITDAQLMGGSSHRSGCCDLCDGTRSPDLHVSLLILLYKIKSLLSCENNAAMPLSCFHNLSKLHSYYYDIILMCFLFLCLLCLLYKPCTIAYQVFPAMICIYQLPSTVLGLPSGFEQLLLQLFSIDPTKNF